MSLDDLLNFFKDPVKGFFRELDYTLPWEVEPIDDAMPVEIDALQEWQVGDRLLNDLMRGVDLEVATGAEWRRGTLPPGKLGWRKARAISDCSADLAMEALRPRGTHPAIGHDIDVDLGARRLTGTVAPVYGDRTVSVTYSRLAAKHLLQAWISLVALGAQRPERGVGGVLRRPRRQGRDQVRMFRPPEDATAVLRDIVAIFDAGRREPLPCRSRHRARGRRSATRAATPAGTRTASGKARADTTFGEDAAEAHVEVWGRKAPLTTLLADKPRPGEEVDGEESRLGALAARLWLPMFKAEGRP